MRREDAIRILNEALPGLKERFRILELGVFGSVARDEAGPDSDIDILVTFEGPTDFDGFMGLQLELEAILGIKVDMGTSKTLKPLVRPHVEKDLIRIL